MADYERPIPSQPERQNPLSAEELKTLHDLFVRAQANGQYFGPGLMSTPETHINGRGSLQEFIAQGLAQVTEEHAAETAQDVSLEHHTTEAEESARIAFEADQRMNKLRKTLGIITWTYAKGIEKLALELLNMKPRPPLPIPIYKPIETDTADENGKPEYHIAMSYKTERQNGNSNIRMLTYTQNLKKGKEAFDDDPRLDVTFKQNGDIESITIMYREIGAGGENNLRDITQLDHVQGVASILREMNLAFRGGYGHCALTLYFGDNKYHPNIEYSQGSWNEKLSTQGVYIYDPEEDKFILIEDKVEEEMKARNKRVDHWDSYNKTSREAAGPNAEGFIQLALEMLSLIPIS